MGRLKQTRYVEGAVESLLRTLKWAGLDFDEGELFARSVDSLLL
jgi:glutamyl/glutaminyl-tRNA synthetase